MPPPVKHSHSEWLSLHDASKKIGVTPATLRHWADQGKVRVYRTPGGHRRFSASEIRALVGTSESAMATTRVESLIHSALGKTRLEIGEGRLENESWYRRFDQAGKERHRELGLQLMSFLVKVLQDEAFEKDLEQSARKLGQEYGHAIIRQKIALTDALRAFLFFRDYVFEGLVSYIIDTEDHSSLNKAEQYRRLNRYVNEILVSLVETCAK